jgi:hypothetical protein
LRISQVSEKVANEKHTAAAVSAKQTLNKRAIKAGESPTNVKAQYPTQKTYKTENINR